jgi:hypothetical protein
MESDWDLYLSTGEIMTFVDVLCQRIIIKIENRTTPFVRVELQRFRAGFESAPTVPCSIAGKSMYLGASELPFNPLYFEGSMILVELLEGSSAGQIELKMV